MDPTEMVRLVDELNLSDEAGERPVLLAAMGITPVVGNMKRMVVGKIFDNRVVSRETLRTQLPRILQTRQEPAIEIVGDNLFAVEFGSEEDRSRALYDGPWHFFQNLMCFKAPVGMQYPSEIVFDEFTTWIQCHNLPIACMQPDVIRNIGERVGRVEEIEVNEGGSCLGQFAPVRVTRPIGKPLKRCVRLALHEGTESRIVFFRYEKLSIFCHTCGRVGHAIRHCSDEGADKTNTAFGQWMRAGRTMETRRPRQTVSNWQSGQRTTEAKEITSASGSSAGSTKAEIDRSVTVSNISRPQVGDEKNVQTYGDQGASSQEAEITTAVREDGNVVTQIEMQLDSTVDQGHMEGSPKDGGSVIERRWKRRTRWPMNI